MDYQNYWNIVLIPGFVTLLFGLLYLRTKRKLNLPPGPYAFPIIGSVIQIAKLDSKRPMVAVQRLGEKYGPVVGLQLGSVYAVGINGFDTIKELENHPDFINRPNDKWILDKSLGLPLGLGFAEGELWFNTRTTVQRLLREYGFGKSEQTYNVVMDELKDFIEKWKTLCKANDGWTKLQISHQFQVVILNVIWASATGERFQSQQDPKLLRLSNLGDRFTNAGQLASGILGLYPKLMYMFPRLSGYEGLLQLGNDLFQFFDEIIQDRIALGDYKNSPSNFIDSFLQLIENNNPENLRCTKFDPNELLKSVYTKENLIGVLQDFSLAGNDTTANTLNFIIRYIVQNPKVQERLHTEIGQVVGPNRLVTMDDKPELIYTQAVIFEGLRISTVGPTIPRRAIKECQFRGYDIPKDTIILPNYFGANMDEQSWENPDIFLPERFLNTSQTKLINTDKILSFGIGKRNCVGENIAKSSLFLILTTFLQQFQFEVDPEFGIPCSRTLETISRNTEPYNIIIRQKF